MSQLVKLSSGISLQVDFNAPQSLREPKKLAVFLHPWPWLGGHKDDSVLCPLASHLYTDNYHILRYNSRGVGLSTGWASFTGFSEAKDLEDLVTWATQQITNLKSLVLIGYSYGSLIASLHPIIPSIKTAHILISYPLGPRGWLTLFHTGTYSAKLRELVHNPDSHVLVIFGDRDEFTSVEKYREWQKSLEEVSASERLRVVEVAAASHFWEGLFGWELRTEIGSWLRCHDGLQTY
ncbi:hypothetical protein E4T56_gene7911 [Termitomyces sp. T112]|nr:hypothetical protein E4T56_gene7911 [Termitomyces sp. T112]KAH0585376.1 hypothetical protein H2248_008613 [Termitomyces sp. 'cryptogamus']